MATPPIPKPPDYGKSTMGIDDPRLYNYGVALDPESQQQIKDTADPVLQSGRVSPDYIQKEINRRKVDRDPTNEGGRDLIFKSAPPASKITVEEDKTRSNKARSTLQRNKPGNFTTDAERKRALQIGQQNTEHTNANTGERILQDIDNTAGLTEYYQGHAKEGEEVEPQRLDATDVNARGNKFYEGDTEHFKENNPLRVTNKEVDDYAIQAAKDLVGYTSGRVVRDPDTGVITQAIPHSSEKRQQSQRQLHHLSTNLLSTFDQLKLDPTDFRPKTEDDLSNMHVNDQAKYPDVVNSYENIAKDMTYLETNRTNKWSGTPKYTTNKGISYKNAGGEDVPLFDGTSEGSDISHDKPMEIMEQDSTDPNSPYYYKPVLSDYKINVSDKQSAVALSHTLRQFFDMQVLYYKKHMELLQVFQLLVIFFEKYNYSINSLMYILEHLIKDKIEVKVGDPIQVPIPIDFTKSIIGMLTDQKKMMNQVALFKSHLGMKDGGFEFEGDKLILPDGNIMAQGAHVHANVVAGNKYNDPANYKPKFDINEDVIGPVISHLMTDRDEVILPYTAGDEARSSAPATTVTIRPLNPNGGPRMPTDVYIDVDTPDSGASASAGDFVQSRDTKANLLRTIYNYKKILSNNNNIDQATPGNKDGSKKERKIAYLEALRQKVIINPALRDPIEISIPSTRVLYDNTYRIPDALFDAI